MKTKYQLSIQEPQNTIRTFGTLYEVQMDTKDRLLCVSTEQQVATHFLLWLKISFLKH